jgi:hypothetical protein
MPVFCVVSNYGYDGYWIPEGVFSSRLAAEVYISGLSSPEKSCAEIHEYEVDVPRKG